MDELWHRGHYVLRGQGLTNLQKGTSNLLGTMWIIKDFVSFTEIPGPPDPTQRGRQDDGGWPGLKADAAESLPGEVKATWLSVIYKNWLCNSRDLGKTELSGTFLASCYLGECDPLYGSILWHNICIWVYGTIINIKTHREWFQRTRQVGQALKELIQSNWTQNVAATVKTKESRAASAQLLMPSFHGLHGKI